MVTGDPEQSERLAYSVREATKITGASKDALYDAIRRGELARVLIGRSHANHEAKAEPGTGQ
jgi:hypothetical protein